MNPHRQTRRRKRLRSVTFSEHAVDVMLRRAISESEVQWIVSHPEQVAPCEGYPGRFLYCAGDLAVVVGRGHSVVTVLLRDGVCQGRRWTDADVRARRVSGEVILP